MKMLVGVVGVLVLVVGLLFTINISALGPAYFRQVQQEVAVGLILLVILAGLGITFYLVYAWSKRTFESKWGKIHDAEVVKYLDYLAAPFMCVIFGVVFVLWIIQQFGYLNNPDVYVPLGLLLAYLFFILLVLLILRGIVKIASYKEPNSGSE